LGKAARERAREAEAMAGIFIIGPPVVGGVVAAGAIQVGMRHAGVGLAHRVTVELGLVAGGGLLMARRPLLAIVRREDWRSQGLLKGHAGNGFAGTHWHEWYLASTMITTGVFAMLAGAAIHVVHWALTTAIALARQHLPLGK